MAPRDHSASDHLTGARFLGAIWIVCAHYLPRGPMVLMTDPTVQIGGRFMNGVLFRDNAAVDFFVVLSGFTTHWAYDNLQVSGRQELAQYYVRRLGRTLITTWLSMLAWCLVEALRGHPPDGGHVARCLIFVEQWRWVPHNWCPSAPAWFVFALLPSWLLYPALRVPIHLIEERGGAGALAATVVALYLVSFGPGFLQFVMQGGNLTWGQSAGMMYYPHVQLPDFLLGVVAAALVRRHQRDLDQECSGLSREVAEDWTEMRSEARAAPRSWPLSLLGDLSLAFIVAVLCLVPTPCLPDCRLKAFGWEPLFNHGLALAIVGFLYGSVASGGAGVAARMLRHRGLVELGNLSFEVYIFQEPLHNAFMLVADVRSPDVFMTYLLSLFAFAALYSRWVQGPLNDLLRENTGNWVRGSLPAYEHVPLPERCSSPARHDADPPRRS